MRVAVIGGGWAGIAAAVELTVRGVPTTLFEAGRVLGGRARSISIDGRVLDNGQHILLGAYRDTLDLMRQVGADPDELFDRQPLRIIDNAGFELTLPHLPTPLNVAWGLLAARGVGLGEKLRTAWWMDAIKRRGFRLSADTSVAQWLDSAGQTGALRRHLWEPLCLAALNTPAESASAQLFAYVLRDSLGSSRRADTDLLLSRVPLGQLLPEPAADWLQARGAELRLGHRVRQLSEDRSRLSVDGESFDAVIVATAIQHCADLLPCNSPPCEFEPIATVYLQFEAGFSLPFPLCNLLGGTGQWVIDRGQGLLGCVLSGHGDWEALSDDALASTLQDELGKSGAATWFKVIREKRATFAARPNLPRLSMSTAYPRLLLAGDHAWADYPATLEGAVRSGRRAARHLQIA